MDFELLGENANLAEDGVGDVSEDWGEKGAFGFSFVVIFDFFFSLVAGLADSFEEAFVHGKF